VASATNSFCLREVSRMTTLDNSEDFSELIRVGQRLSDHRSISCYRLTSQLSSIRVRLICHHLSLRSHRRLVPIASSTAIER
jgi:hypothetical protein